MAPPHYPLNLKKERSEEEAEDGKEKGGKGTK